jgi:hypothetical protein
MTDLPIGRPLSARHAAIRTAVEDWKARFPDITQAWLHQSEDGRRIWLTDGEHGPVLATHTLPTQEEEKP